MPKKTNNNQNQEERETPPCQKTKAVRKQTSKEKKCQSRYIPNKVRSKNIKRHRRTNLRYSVFIGYIDYKIKQKNLQRYLPQGIMKNKCFKGHLYKLSLFQELGTQEKSRVLKEIIKNGLAKFKFYSPQDQKAINQDKESLRKFIKTFQNDQSQEEVQQKFLSLYKSRKKSASRIFNDWKTWSHQTLTKQYLEKIPEANRDYSSDNQQRRENKSQKCSIQENISVIIKGGSFSEQIGDNLDEFIRETFSKNYSFNLSDQISLNSNVRSFDQNQNILDQKSLNQGIIGEKNMSESVEVPHSFSKDDICKHSILEASKQKRSKLKYNFVIEL